MKNSFYKLMLITHRQSTPIDKYLNFIKMCAQSGITSVQLREKDSPYNVLLEFGRKILEVITPFDIPLIINDHLDLAFELQAGGVHLGQSDQGLEKARDMLGPNKIIGVSIDSFSDLQTANILPLDYVGVGAIFPTQTKVDIPTFCGLEGLRNLATLSYHPVVAIGGVNQFNAPEVIQAGAQGIAAIDVFHRALDPKDVTLTLCKMMIGN